MKKSVTFWKIFLLVLIVNIIALNWNDLSWIFNYRFASKKIQSIVKEEVVEKKEEGEDLIEINSIEISAPLVFAQGEDNALIEAALKKGVVHFPNSALPGEEGLVILLGHSSPPGWPKFDYDWVFSDVESLNNGDRIEIRYQGRRFIYQVTDKVILERGEEVPLPEADKSEIILLSCWPPGKNIKRIGIRGELL